MQFEDSLFSCPVCGLPLHREEKSLKCENNHCFDLARQGYVNLLRSNQSSSKRHGDDNLMVLARQEFLDSGAYACLSDAVNDLLAPRLKKDARVLDVGCGEGYYTARLRAVLGEDARLCGIDISRQALIAAHRRDPALELAVASSAQLPVGPGSMDAVLNIFAPLSAEETHRVLKPGGLLLRAVPLRSHLMGLKRAVYDTPYENPDPEPEFPPFRLVERVHVQEQLTLTEPRQIRNLFSMTPYYYKTSRADQQKLEALEHLETELAFGLFLYEA